VITNNKRRDDLADFGVVKWYSRLWGLVVTHVLPALPGRQAFALADPVALLLAHGAVSAVRLRDLAFAP